MKKTATALICALPLLAVPVLAQDDYQPPAADQGVDETMPGDAPDDDPGSLLERGAQSLLRDLFSDVEPHMNSITRELGLRIEEFSPVLKDLGNLMDDIRHYQAPERLENGDILIRRKAGAPPPPVVSRRFQDLVEPSPENRPKDSPDALPAPDGTGAGKTGEVEL